MREIPRFVKASSVVNEVGTSVTGTGAFIAEVSTSQDSQADTFV